MNSCLAPSWGKGWKNWWLGVLKHCYLECTFFSGILSDSLKKIPCWEVQTPEALCLDCFDSTWSSTIGFWYNLIIFLSTWNTFCKWRLSSALFSWGLSCSFISRNTATWQTLVAYGGERIALGSTTGAHAKNTWQERLKNKWQGSPGI